METTLAIYEALIQANVPPPAARRVAESLEKDMSSNLATKQDLQQLSERMAARFEAVDIRFEVLESRMNSRVGALEDRTDFRFTALESRIDSRFEEADKRTALMIHNLESRIVIKLGALMTVLFGVASAVVALLH